MYTSLSAPTYWARALINGDYSGLNDAVVLEILEWAYGTGMGSPKYAVHEGPGYWNGKLMDISTYLFPA